jgi:hypothetical protein
MNYRIEFFNSNEKGATLIVEPWPEEFDLPPNKLIALEITSPAPGVPQLELRDQFLICYIWAGSTAAIFIDGVCVSEGKMQIPVPAV